MELFRTQYLSIAAAAWLSVPQPAAADTVSILPIKDNTLYESADRALSNGRGRNFFSGVNDSGQKRRGIIAFDIASNVPAGSTIRSASLTLHMSQTTGNPVSISLHWALADWGEGNSIPVSEHEGGGTRAAQGDATWLHTFYNTSLWSTPGGDFSSVPSAGLLVAGVDFYTWPSTTQVISDVQSWLDSPQVNFGWVVVADNESTPHNAKRFDTRENQNPDFRPVLLVQFTPSTDAGGSIDARGDGGLSDGVPDAGGVLSRAPPSSGGCQSGSSLILGLLTVFSASVTIRARRPR